MSFERLWYETSPYVYGLLGIVVMLGFEETLGRLSGALLVVAAGTILWLRWVNRHRRDDIRAKAARKRLASRQARAQPRGARPARPAR